jgi:hypothetical protein
VLPYENKAEYDALADAMVRDLRPAGVLQREIVTQITQICRKLRRIPAIEEAILEGQVGDMEKEFERQKYFREIEQDAEFPQPTAAMLIASQFMMQGDRPFERLEQYQLRLQRSLQSAHRHLEKMRGQTAGEEIVVPQQDQGQNESAQNKPNEEDKSLEVQEKREDQCAPDAAGINCSTGFQPEPEPAEARVENPCYGNQPDPSLLREDS